MVDDSGDRKDGSATAHVGKQYLGSVRKIDRGVVTMTTCWADERVYYAVHACPYTPAHDFPRGKSDLGFRTKLQIAAARAKAAGLFFRAVAADCAYGDQDSFRPSLHAAGLPFMTALKPRHGTWAYGPDHTPVDAARLLAWRNADRQLISAIRPSQTRDKTGRLSGRMSGSARARVPERRQKPGAAYRAGSEDASGGVRRSAELGADPRPGTRRISWTPGPMGASFRIRSGYGAVP
ncbi:transposase [Streptomyces sp. NPDC057717]|uniref:transposase n=1 Tax=Streptomyces sp. NPDC057717 TaxID=3346224 RepID=UPI0036C62383